MGLGDLWPPHSREDSKAGLCHFFYFAVTSAARVRRPPRLFSWITAICAAVVQLQECGHPPLLRLSLLLMFCTLCSSVTYYTIILYLVQEKSLFEAAAVVVEAVGGRVVDDDGVILGSTGGGLCWKC